MRIAGEVIGPDFKPYVIAELSANHRGSAGEGYKLLQAAADCGADACKIQCYTADGLTFPNENVIKAGPWKGKTLHELYSEAQTPPKLVKDLFEYAKKNKITYFSVLNGDFFIYFSLNDVQFSDL